MKDKNKKQVRGEVNSEVKRKFDAAYRFKGIGPNEAIQEAMILFTEKHIKDPGVK